MKQCKIISDKSRNNKFGTDISKPNDQKYWNEILKGILKCIFWKIFKILSELIYNISIKIFYNFHILTSPLNNYHLKLMMSFPN